MISKTFYTEDRFVSYFFDNTLKHYPRKERTKVLEFTTYEVKSGDTMYSIASELFGEQGEYHWTIISDLNNNRKPDDLHIGELLKVPKIILAELINRLPTYEQNTSTATKI